MKQILFVCLGNICRSPSAEAVMESIIERENLKGQIAVDSAGIIGFHAGEPADSRMQAHANKRGYKLNSISRQITPDIDFDKYDMIIGMDDKNMKDLRSLDPERKYKDKMHLMTSFCERSPAEEVPDPYYSGAAGFEHVLDLLEDACEGLVNNITGKTAF